MLPPRHGNARAKSLLRFRSAWDGRHAAMLRCPAHRGATSASRAARRLSTIAHPSVLTDPSRSRCCHYSTEPATVSHDVGVLGGGITGLASAYYLTRELPNAKVTLYESKENVGGWLQSHRVPVKDGTILFEAGPRTLRPQSNGVLTASLMQDLDLTKDAIFTQRTSPAARNRFLYYPDHLVRMPHPSHGLADNIWSLITEPVFQTAVWSGVTEFWKNPRDPSVQDESIGSFFSRRLSKPMVDRILSGVIHGVYAGDVYQLSVKSLFPQLWRDELEHGSVILGALHSRTEGVKVAKREADFLQEMKQYQWDPLLKATLRDTSVFTFKDGLKMLTDKLYTKLFETGRVEFKTSSPVESLDQAEGNTGIQVKIAGKADSHKHSHIISALSPWHLDAITRGPSNKQMIPTIPTVTVMTVNLYFRTPNMHDPGFGYLIPQATPFENNPERALGVVFDTAYSPGPGDLDPANWHDLNVDQLKEAREQGRLINVNNFAWYNMPDKPNHQDDVTARGTKVTVMLGGHWWDGWPSYPDEQEGVALARSVLERQLGIKEEPEAWKVNLEQDCIPQYTVGHEQRLQQAHNNIWREYKGRLRVAGNWMSGAGVNDCIRTAFDIAKNIRKDGTGLEHIGEEPSVRVKIMPIKPGGKKDGND